MKRIEIPAGETIDRACQNAINHARIEGCDISFSFNGQEIIARYNSSWKDLCTIYDLKCHIERVKMGYV